MKTAFENPSHASFPCLSSKAVAMRPVDERRAAGSVHVPGYGRIGLVMRAGTQPCLRAHPPVFVSEARRRSFLADCAARVTYEDDPDSRWFGLWMDPVDGEVTYQLRLIDDSLESFETGVQQIVEFFKEHGSNVADLAIRDPKGSRGRFADDDDDDGNDDDNPFSPRNLLRLLNGR